ncbi:hypothetical protein ACFL0I_00125 [Gemmatimonadota bacterium]
MSESPKPPRLYKEKEVGKILQRATEFHLDSPGHSPGSLGELSLAELEEIALEAGIELQDLRRAAMELDSGELSISGWARFLGERIVLVREAIIPGEIPQAGFERVITAVRQAAGEFGEPSFLGRTLTWQAETSGKMRSIVLVVAAQDGETHIRIEERLDQFALALFGGTLGGVGGGVGLGAGLPLAAALGSLLLGIPILLGVMGLTHMGTRPIYRAYVGKRRKALDDLMDRVTRQVTSAISSASLQGTNNRKQISGS